MVLSLQHYDPEQFYFEVATNWCIYTDRRAKKEDPNDSRKKRKFSSCFMQIFFKRNCNWWIKLLCFLECFPLIAEGHGE